MLKNFLIFLVWVGACTGVYYATHLSYPWAMPIFALVTLLGFLGIALVRSGKKGGSTLNSIVLLALLPVQAQSLVAVALLFAWLVVRNSSQAYADGSNYHYGSTPKWYRNPKFSLLPLLVFKHAGEHNTAGFSFDWLFLRLWTLDAVGFEFAIVADSHWGIGVNGILPYLRWVCCIPCPERLSMWLQTKLWRRPKPEASSTTGLAMQSW